MLKKLIIILIIITAIIVGVFVFRAKNNKETFAAATKSGLVGYWTFDNNDTSGTKVYDRSGQNRHGTKAGAAGTNNTPKSIQGKIREALDFDTTDDTVTISSYPANFGTGDMSVGLWFKTTTSTNTTAPLIDCAVIGAINSGFGLYMQAGDTAPRFAIDDGVTGGTSVAANNYPANDNKWHHVVGVRDTSGSNLIKIYLDGVLDNTGANIAGSISSVDDLTIGSYYSGGANYRYNGQIDDVRVYNRALSAQEVADLYNSAKTNFTNTPTRASSTVSAGNKLVGHWTMDAGDNAGGKMLDKSGFNNNGSIIGTTTSTGRVKQARNFNGTSDYIYVADSTSMKSVSQVTVSFWTKLNSLTTNTTCTAASNVQYAFFKRNNRTTNNFEGYVVNISGASGWCFVVSTDGGVQDYACTTTGLDVGKWHHILGVFNKPNLSIYVDGVQRGSDTHNADLAFSTRPFFIGRSGECGGVGEANYDAYFNGIIDDVRVYNYGMSAQEVSDLYNSAKTNYSNTPSRTGLVGHWTMDNQDRSRNLIYDKSSFNNSGTLIGTTTSTGRIKEARTFNGSSDYIYIANESNFDFERTQPFTLSAWIYSSSLATTQMIFSKQTGGTTGWLWLKNTNGTLGMYLVNSWPGNAIQVNTTDTVQNFKWYHIVMSYSGSSNASGVGVYINGIAAGTSIILNTLSATMLTNENVWIGRRNHIDNLYFNGKIDDVRIYNRALSAQEVANLYNAARGNYK